MAPDPSSNSPGHAAVIRYTQEHRDTIRRAISSCLGKRLRQVFSTTDIENSLLAYLLKKAEGPTPFTDRELERLGLVIAIRLVQKKARHEHLSRRVVLGPEQEPLTGPADNATERAASDDFLGCVRTLANDDWPLVEARVLLERHYDELAGLFGATADALRMRLRRALDRIAEQMGGDADE